MNDTEKFLNSLSDTAYEVEKRLSDILDESVYTDLCGAMRYSALSGGKRLRAYLVTAFCRLCGKDITFALDYACAVEMVHAFSLIHDDLPAMDNDVLRRGKPTSHVAFGEATAILAGDALALDAFGVVANNKFCNVNQNFAAMKVLSERSGAMGMCRGQKIDIDSEGENITREELELLVDRKTGDLFACSCELGCIAAGANKKIRASAIKFGLDIGRAFQITDDLLDLNSTAEVLGKSVGKDEKAAKSTYPSLLGEDGARRYAAYMINEAKTELLLFGESEAKTELFGLCDYILIRNK